ncbi:hypothetical protein F240042I4_03750 [Eisenbergiella tayi]|jgi:hypothetical protein
MCGGNTKETYIEEFCFRHHYRRFVFVEDQEVNGENQIEKYFEVFVAVDVCGTKVK